MKQLFPVKPPTISPEATSLAKATHEAQVKARVTMAALGKRAIFLRELYRGRTQEPGFGKLAEVAAKFQTTVEKLQARAHEIEGLQEHEANRGLDGEIAKQTLANRELLLQLYEKLSPRSQIEVIEDIIRRLPPERDA